MLNVKIDGVLVTIENLNKIKSPLLRKRIINNAAKSIIKSSRSRTDKQVTVDGAPFGKFSENTNHRRPRKGKRQFDKRMLSRLVRKLSVINQTDNSAEVGWKNTVQSNIAAKHQFGFTQTVNKSDQKKNDQNKKKDDPATRSQAKSLLDVGYKVKRKEGKGGWKSPTIKWITQNLTIGRAGLILRLLRGTKESWQTKAPARPFLGITESDLQEIATSIKAEIEKSILGATA